MRKFYLLPPMMLVFVAVIVARGITYGQHYPLDLLRQYAKSKPDTSRVHLLLKLSTYYLLKPLEIQTDLDSALMLAKEAKQLSSNLKYIDGEEEADFQIGTTYVEAKNYLALLTLLKTLSDTTRIKVMLQLADYKIQTKGNTKVDWESGAYYANQALEQSRSVHSTKLELNSLYTLGVSFAKNRNFQSMKPVLMQALAISKKSGYPEWMSALLRYCLLYFCNDKEVFGQIKSLWRDALANCKNDLEKKNIADVEDSLLSSLTQGSMIFQATSQQDYGEGFFSRTLELIGDKAEYHPACYAGLCVAYQFQGDYTKSLYFGLKAEKLAKSDLEKMPFWAYPEIGRLYFRRGNIDESILYFQKGIAAAHYKGMSEQGYIFKHLARAYMAKRMPSEALALLEDAMKDSATMNPYDIKDILESEGEVYMAMGNFDKAEQRFLQCRELAKSLSVTDKLMNDLAFGKLYVQTRQYEKAKGFLDSLSKKENKAIEPLFVQEEVALLRFRVDSAHGNFKDAITSLQENKLIHDAIFNDAKNKQFEELKIQYETDKKNKDIELLTKQSLLQASKLKEERLRFEYEKAIKEHELEQAAFESSKKDNELKLAHYESEKKANDVKIKEQSIDLLKKEDKIKTSALQTTTLLRNLFIGGAILLLLLVTGIYYRYLKNQKTNRLLQSQQRQLQLLNRQQQHLLEEKDWLLKEIHHRVKNNLQIVMSLLNSQTAYIDNQSALTAIHDSQHRVHAMSLIHQKLYNSENVAAIDMSVYIRELTSYLADSFNINQRIRFEFAVESLEMDVSQAVPLGLILNEAITNSIKYAFPDGMNGVVSISLSSTTPNQYLLSISDNGIGMPLGSNNKKPGSLGMSLMKGLSGDLDGNLSIENKNGTTIKISFSHDLGPKRPDKLTTSFVSNN